jgi:uncharacterized membrane protein YgcG
VARPRTLAARRATSHPQGVGLELVEVLAQLRVEVAIDLVDRLRHGLFVLKHARILRDGLLERVERVAKVVFGAIHHVVHKERRVDADELGFAREVLRRRGLGGLRARLALRGGGSGGSGGGGGGGGGAGHGQG